MLALHWSCAPGSRALHAEGGQFAAYYATSSSPGVLTGDAADRELSRALEDACAAGGLAPDGRLAELARVLAEATQEGRLTPTAELVGHHAHRLGLVEPTPHIWMGSASTSSEVVPALREAVSRVGHVERLTHCGGAALAVQGGLLVAVAVSRRLVTLEPVPRVLPSGGELSLRGTLARGFDRASLAVTGPSGGVTQLSLPAGRGIRHALRLKERGEHMLELLAEGASGVTVVAMFPVAVGVEPNTRAPSLTRQVAERDPESVAKALAELIARERKQRGLTPLKLDPRLSQVALLHSQDMLAQHFVAHTSPTTGDAPARVARAGLRPLVLLENIGRRYSAADLHAGLMESPGHRANILNPDVDVLGLGVVSEPEGERVAFLATELFARFAAPFDPERAPRQLADAVAVRRKQRKLAAVRLDAALSRAAQQSAEHFAAQPNVGQHALLDQTTRSLKSPPRGVDAVVAALVLAEEVAQVADAEQLLDPRAVALGIGVAALAPDAEHGLVVVLLVGLRSR